MKQNFPLRSDCFVPADVNEVVQKISCKEITKHFSTPELNISHTDLSFVPRLNLSFSAKNVRFSFLSEIDCTSTPPQSGSCSSVDSFLLSVGPSRVPCDAIRKPFVKNAKIILILIFPTQNAGPYIFTWAHSLLGGRPTFWVGMPTLSSCPCTLFGCISTLLQLIFNQAVEKAHI